ncbi:MAG: NADH-quinone oxidoreductase subunit L [Thermodesulfobacteriota bacterium]|nr:MAG: NADH-quinone oxidoreductase subunit L [Thermodesulfobacteriota bacterium]
MKEFLWLIPALPFAGFLALILAGRSMPARLSALVGTGAVGLSAISVFLIGIDFVGSPPPEGFMAQSLWTWVELGWFRADAALRLDALSLAMAAVITFTAFLILVYSAEFMAEDEGYSRFFAYMDLFVAFMLVLVLADNFLFLYLGWEGVGLCSFLLIGFRYKEGHTGYAARKAFIMTRAGDTAFLVGIILLAASFGTLDIQTVMEAGEGAASGQQGSAIAALAALLILAGALGKSAQAPLQTWLPDAMAGPTPVSALIHAATMVAAGVYLIARTHAIFDTPPVMSLIAALGAATLLVSGLSALVQSDIKRALAYSTMGQVGFMFLALGAGYWQAAIFHFMTHAFFKALLFLSAGAVITALGGEHDMRRMGGLRKRLPLAFWSFLIGAASLSALPLVTAGYYSKDLILKGALAGGGALLWGAGIIGALVTALYAFRMVFLVFFGEAGADAARRTGLGIAAPLVLLSALALFSGFIGVPSFLGVVTPLPDTDALAGAPLAGALSAIVPVLGAAAAYFVFFKRRGAVEGLPEKGFAAGLHAFIRSGWGFDRLYERLFVRPYLLAARAGREDFMDAPYAGAAKGTELLSRLLAKTQSGQVRRYAAGMTLGALLALGALAFI